MMEYETEESEARWVLVFGESSMPTWWIRMGKVGNKFAAIPDWLAGFTWLKLGTNQIAGLFKLNGDTIARHRKAMYSGL